MEDLKSVGSHFRFGENWKSFLSTVTTESIREAERGLLRLFPNGELRGSRFLDIGCGSGLSMVAAHGLGAVAVEGIDIDPQSVEASSALLREHVPEGRWSVRLASVFDLAPEGGPSHDIVYSWGVLHHTGDVWTAIERAARMVASDGRIALALYRRTALCGFWKREKRIYAKASPRIQGALRALYYGVYWAGLLVTGRNPLRYVANYRSARGMDWRHDVHDWLGGYPYESVDPEEVAACLERIGFHIERIFEHPAAAGGVFGSHCDEYVGVRRKPSLAAP
jgi:2-polyprenyl-6-hydroxyphenyl methylase/3-demethylubiquinone-9 3-methyltransferase